MLKNVGEICFSLLTFQSKIHSHINFERIDEIFAFCDFVKKSQVLSRTIATSSAVDGNFWEFFLCLGI